MKQILAGLFFVALAGFFAWLLGPPLLADVSLRGEKLEVARDVRITEARCRSKLFIISFCDMKLERAGARTEMNYLIVDSLGGSQVTAMRGTGQNRSVTTNIGMDQLINRIVSFAAVMLFAGVGGLWSVAAGVRSLAGTRAG